METPGGAADARELEAEYLTLAPLNKGVNLRLSTPVSLDSDAGEGGAEGNLFVCSDSLGYIVVGDNQGFALHSLASIRESISSASAYSTPTVAPQLHVPLNSRVDFIKLGDGEMLLVVGCRDGSLGVWDLRTLITGAREPLHLSPPSSRFLDILPCPSAPTVVVLSLGTLVLFCLSTFQPLLVFPPQLAASSASWSVKGKQIAVGSRGGAVGLYTPAGELKGGFECPPELRDGGWEVRSIHWLENTVFLTTYAKSPIPGEPPNQDYELYIVSKGVAGYEFVKFIDPTPAFGMMQRHGRRWISGLKDWSPFKHLLFTTNAPSAEIGVIGQLNPAADLTASASATTWATVSLPETARPSIPLTEIDSDDTCCLGLELDLSFSPPPRPQIASTDEDGTGTWGTGESDAEKAGPRLMLYTSDGILATWRIVNDMGGAYPGLLNGGGEVVEPAPIVEMRSETPIPTIKPTAFAAFGAPSASAFAVAAPAAAPTSGFGSSGFGAPAFGKSSSGFGSSGFGTAAAGGFAGFGAAAVQPAAVAAPSSGGFGSFTTPSTASASVTPSTGGFSGFGASTSTGGFAGFGGAAKPGASIFGNGGAFGAAPAFGSASTPAVSAFGTAPSATLTANPFATSTNVFGSTNAFGSGTTKPLGGSVFGGDKAPATFGTVSTTAAPLPSAFAPLKSTLLPSTAGRLQELSDDDEEEDAGGDEGRVRGDDPPDLEPTQTNLVFGDIAPRPVATPSKVPIKDVGSPFTASATSTTAGSLNFGGLGFGTPPPVAKPTTSTLFGPPVVIPVVVSVAQPTVAPPIAKVTVGFGFGASAARPSAASATGFGFGNRPSPSLSIYASAPPTAPPPAQISEIEPVVISPSPSSPLTPTTPIIAFPPGSVTPALTPTVEVPPPVQAAPASTKSFFGFTSSPPSSSKKSLLERMGGIGQTLEGEGEEEEEEEEFSGEEEEEYDEEDGRAQFEEGEEEYDEGEQEESYEEEEEDGYNEEDLYDESERSGRPVESRAPSQSVGEKAAVQRVDKSNNPLLARLDSARSVDSASSTTPAASPSAAATPSVAAFSFKQASTPTVSSPFALSTKNPFGIATPSLAPTPPPEPVSSPPPTTAPAAKPSLGGFGQAPGAGPAKPTFFGYTSAAPRASSPLSSTTATSAKVPSGFSFAPVPAAPLPPVVAPGSTTLPRGLTIPASVPLPLSAPSTPSIVAITSSPFSLPPPAPSTFGPRTSTPPPPPAPVEPPAPTRISIAATSTPKLAAEMGSVKDVKVEEGGMTGEFLKAYQILNQEFDLLRKNTNLCKDFVKEIRVPVQSGVDTGRSAYSDVDWSLGDLGRLIALTKKSAPKIEDLVEIAVAQKRQVAELQSLLLKAETKREEAARFIRARDDPVFAKMVRVRQLGPEQLEHQKLLRSNVEAATLRIEQLEKHIGLLKEKVMENKLGRSSFKTPSLDAVSRTVRNISGAVIEKTLEVDELNLRLNRLKINATSSPFTPSKSTRRSFLTTDDSFVDSPFKASPSATSKPTLCPKAIAAANAALLAERNAAIIKRALLSVRTTPIFNTSANAKSGSSSNSKGPISDLQLAFQAGPITGDRLPLPRRAVKLASPIPVAPIIASSFVAPPPPTSDSPTPTWSFSTPPIASSSTPSLKAPAFIQFSSNSTSAFPPARSATSPSGRSNNARPRQHGTAISLKSKNEHNKDFVANTSTFDWGPVPVPQTSTAASGRDYISFDGLQLPEKVRREEREADSDEVEGDEDEGDYDDERDGERDGEDGWSGEEEEYLDDIAEEREE